jgi:hypothetical protein
MNSQSARARRLVLHAADQTRSADVGTAARASRFRLASGIPEGTPRLPAGLPTGLMPWQRAGPPHHGPSDKAHLPGEHR